MKIFLIQIDIYKWVKINGELVNMYTWNQKDMVKL